MARSETWNSARILFSYWDVIAVLARDWLVLAHSCFSLGKEKGLYEKEVKEQEAKIETMKAESRDEYEVKKQVNLLK